MEKISNVLCPICRTEMESYVKSSLGLLGVLLEGKCLQHGLVRVRYKDGKLYSETGIRPYQSFAKKEIDKNK